MEASASSQVTDVIGAMKRKITAPKWFTPSEKKGLAVADVVEGPPVSMQGKRGFHGASEEDEKVAEREVKKIKLCSEADNLHEAASGNYGPDYPGSSDNEADSETESKSGTEVMGKVSSSDCGIEPCLHH